MTKSEFISLISHRGDAYGGKNGTLDLLMWCNKISLAQVTKEEAQRFWEDPLAPYETDATAEGAAK